MILGAVAAQGAGALAGVAGPDHRRRSGAPRRAAQPARAAVRRAGGAGSSGGRRGRRRTLRRRRSRGPGCGAPNSGCPASSPSPPAKAWRRPTAASSLVDRDDSTGSSSGVPAGLPRSCCPTWCGQPARPWASPAPRRSRSAVSPWPGRRCRYRPPPHRPTSLKTLNDALAPVGLRLEVPVSTADAAGADGLVLGHPGPQSRSRWPTCSAKPPSRRRRSSTRFSMRCSPPPPMPRPPAWWSTPSWPPAPPGAAGASNSAARRPGSATSRWPTWRRRPRRRLRSRRSSSPPAFTPPAADPSPFAAPEPVPAPTTDFAAGSGYGDSSYESSAAGGGTDRPVRRCPHHRCSCSPGREHCGRPPRRHDGAGRRLRTTRPRGGAPGHRHPRPGRQAPPPPPRRLTGQGKGTLWIREPKPTG